MAAIWQTLLMATLFLVGCLAKEITDINYSNLSYEPISPLLYPHQGWTAKFDFEISDLSDVEVGDYFNLALPRVYRVKFNSDNEALGIYLNDGTEVFTCVPSQQAANIYDETIVTCSAKIGLSQYESIKGNMSFSLTFSYGNVSTGQNVAYAKYFKEGTMTIPLMADLEAPITFDSSSFNSEVYAIGRETTYNTLESYYLDMACPNGFLLGGSQQINYDLDNNGHDLDCSSAKTSFSNQFNDWWIPTTDENDNAEVICFGNNLWITVGQAEPGYNLYINAEQKLPDGQQTIRHDVHVDYTCSNTLANSTYETQLSTTIEYIVYEGVKAGTASVILPNISTKMTSSSSSVPMTSSTTVAATSFTPSSKVSSTSQSTTTITETTCWNQSFMSEYSVTTVTDESGTLSVPQVIVYVQTPMTPITYTSTTSWTGSFTNTYSTETSYLSGTEGCPTPQVIIYVETPNSVTSSTSTPQITTTITETTCWNQSFMSEYSVTTVTDESGTLSVPQVIVYVQTPMTPITYTSTTSWTGSFTNTYSTETSYLSGTEGCPTPQVIIYVETPTPSTPTSTSTSTPTLTSMFVSSTTPITQPTTSMGVITVTESSLKTIETTTCPESDNQTKITLVTSEDSTTQWSTLQTSTTVKAATHSTPDLKQSSSATPKTTVTPVTRLTTATDVPNVSKETTTTSNVSSVHIVTSSKHTVSQYVPVTSSWKTSVSQYIPNTTTAVPPVSVYEGKAASISSQNIICVVISTIFLLFSI